MSNGMRLTEEKKAALPVKGKPHTAGVQPGDTLVIRSLAKEVR